MLSTIQTKLVAVEASPVLFDSNGKGPVGSDSVTYSLVSRESQARDFPDVADYFLYRIIFGEGYWPSMTMELFRIKGKQVTNDTVPTVMFPGLVASKRSLATRLQVGFKGDRDLFIAMFPGWGRWDFWERPQTRFYDIATWYGPRMLDIVQQILQVERQDDVPPLYALGHSMGGNIWMMMLSLAPEIRPLIAKLAVISSPVDFSQMSSPIITIAAKIHPILAAWHGVVSDRLREPFFYLVQRGLFSLMNFKSFQHQAGHLFWGKGGPDKGGHASVRKSAVRPGPVSVWQEYFAMILDESFSVRDGVNRYAVPPGLAEYSNPLLLATSHADLIVPHAASYPLFGHVGTPPQDQFHIEMARAGHWDQLRSKDLWRRIHWFFAGKLTQNHMMLPAQGKAA